MPPALQYRILGPLEVVRDGQPLALGGAKPRALLAILLVHANRAVSTNDLVEALWPQEQPATPRTAIQRHIAGLRRSLAPDRRKVIVTEPSGYRLVVEGDSLDLARFEVLLRAGCQERGAGRSQAAQRTLSEALALFSDLPLVEFADEDWARLEIARLQELRLTCREELIEAGFQLGRHADLVRELESLVAEHPLRERVRSQLMLALYRSGRQTDALAVYEDVRRRLDDDFGIDPTAALQAMELAILVHDPALGPATEPPVSTPAEQPQALLFSDIECSTRLVRHLGRDYGAVLLEHRRLLGEVVATNSGRTVDAHGDGYFAVFDSVLDATSAAASAQISFARHPWPHDSRVSIRLGLHHGEPTPVGGGFVGLDVHRASRLCAAAHGGQVLLSEAMVEGLAGTSPSGVTLLDLGTHVLPGLGEPERLFQLVIGDLPAAFPPPRVGPAYPAAEAEHSILVVADDDSQTDALVAIAKPLAVSQPGREVILARMIPLLAESAEDEDTVLALESLRTRELAADLSAQGVPARSATFISQTPGADIVELVTEQAVDLALLARSPSEMSHGPLDDELTAILAGAPCDVGVCVSGQELSESSSGPVLVPFAGSEHDWAALEVAAWFASSQRLSLRVVGLQSARERGHRDSSRLLASASLAVQQLVGVPAEPALVAPGPKALREATGEGSLILMGIPGNWRERGLGSSRVELARAATIPVVFVRRGARPGGLAPKGSKTRFTWSISDVAVRSPSPS